ncbi:hypothetical protein Val02_05010 [Virgisporangium aliadipatigenens]|uniref:Uncharacterized protein n=1 Tax=Virgisporangium aliadipatigenens TaxID=741659 RepID=A0A8J4DMB6_9ACTN|nr:hypothetical protein Val02_05010 [Virgisporangium aliadipatigenens]
MRGGAGDAEEFGAGTRVVARPLEEPQLAAQQDPGAGGTDPGQVEPAFAPVVPGGLPVAGLVGQVVLLAQAHRAVLPGPGERLVAPAGGRAGRDDGGRTQFDQGFDRGLVGGDAVGPPRGVDLGIGGQPRRERHLGQHDHVRPRRGDVLGERGQGGGPVRVADVELAGGDANDLAHAAASLRSPAP